MSFAAPSNTTLSASTTYHVVAYNVGGNSSSAQVTRTSSNNEDSGKADGWSIANRSSRADVDQPVAATSWQAQLGIKLQIQVKGYANTATQSTDATLSALTGSTSTDGSAFTGTLTLSPAFAAATEDYIATVPNNVTHMKVTPTAEPRPARPSRRARGRA